MKFVEIAVSTATYGPGAHEPVVFALGEDGRVYRYVAFRGEWVLLSDRVGK